MAEALGRQRPGLPVPAPWFVGFLGLTIGPMLELALSELYRFRPADPRQWVGTANYERIFTNDPKFAQSMRVTLFFVIFSVPLKLAFALSIALLLNRGMRGLPVYRAIFYLPSLLGASVAIAILWRQLFAGDGVVNDFLAIFGIEGPSWISNPRYSLWTLIVLADLAVRLADDHFSRGPQADPRTCTRPRASTAPAAGASS